MIGRPSLPTLPMPATDFEFRHRFWIIGAAFGVGFGLYNLDHVEAVARVMGWVAPSHAVTVPGGPVRSTPAGGVVTAGAAVIFLAAWIRTWAAAYLRSDVVHDDRLHAERLVADGPYRHVRNPLYLGTILLAVGMAPLASLSGALVMVTGIVLITTRLVAREERALTATQGSAYGRYREAVPRLLPAPTPRVPASGIRPRWGQAIWGEALMWAFAVGTLLIGVTLNPRLGMGVWVAGFVLHFLRRGASGSDAAADT